MNTQLWHNKKIYQVFISLLVSSGGDLRISHTIG